MCVLGCLLFGDKTQIFKGSQETNGFLFLLVDYQARCNKHGELYMFRITNYELFNYTGSCNVVFSLDYFASHLECQTHYLVRNFYASESFINVCVQVKIIYLIHMDMEADQNSNGEERVCLPIRRPSALLPETLQLKPWPKATSIGTWMEISNYANLNRAYFFSIAFGS